MLERVENKVGRGWPDIHGVVSGEPFWMELKVLTAGLKVRFQPTQPKWIDEYTRIGGTVWVAVRVIKPRVEEAIRLYPGSEISGLVEKGIRLRPYGFIPKPYDWDEFAETLRP